MRSLLSLGRAVCADGRSIDGAHRRRSDRWTPSGVRLRSLFIGLSAGACVLAGALSPQYALADALPGAAPAQGSPGLPDGRLYEQASPTNKFGNQAGSPLVTPPAIVAGVGGNEVAYYKSGPLGETPTGFDFFSISRRTTDGWKSRGAVARNEGLQGAAETNPEWGLGYSQDMSFSVFGAKGFFTPEEEGGLVIGAHVYRYSESGQVQWLSKPTISDPLPGGSTKLPFGEGELMGGSPDFSTTYFTYEGTLVPADDEPNPAYGGRSRRSVGLTFGGLSFGLYEWHDGTLEAAGVLPDGRISPLGTSSVAISEDGTRAFFASTDPSGAGELYVRETAPDGTHRTVLVSRDELLPETGGLPAEAPTGGNGMYVSPDGSQAYFQSSDQLTPDAPNDGSLKEYDFNTATNELTYTFPVAPYVTVISSSHDGSDLLFEHGGELELWNGGVVTRVAPLEQPIEYPRSAKDGSVFAFLSSNPFAGLHFNNGGGGFPEVYRYDVAEGTLSCISCPPVGTPLSSDTSMSHEPEFDPQGGSYHFLTPDRSISDDGSRVFFDTSTPLVPTDTNGVRDVYAWEDGVIHLISTGVSPRESYFGDNSPSGNDVFFSTAEGLSSGDTDDGYDIYDARIPRPGDQLPPAVVPCEGEVCQGPPSVPQLLSPPASEVFDGAGNLVGAPSATHSAPKSLTRAQKLMRALNACKRQKGVRKRAKCRSQAHKRYGAKAAAKDHGGHLSENRHHNGRSK